MGRRKPPDVVYLDRRPATVLACVCGAVFLVLGRYLTQRQFWGTLGPSHLAVLLALAALAFVGLNIGTRWARVPTPMLQLDSEGIVYLQPSLFTTVRRAVRWAEVASVRVGRQWPSIEVRIELKLEAQAAHGGRATVRWWLPPMLLPNPKEDVLLLIHQFHQEAPDTDRPTGSHQIAREQHNDR